MHWKIKTPASYVFQIFYAKKKKKRFLFSFLFQIIEFMEFAKNEI